MEGAAQRICQDSPSRLACSGPSFTACPAVCGSPVQVQTLAGTAMQISQSAHLRQIPRVCVVNYSPMNGGGYSQLWPVSALLLSSSTRTTCFTSSGRASVCRAENFKRPITWPAVSDSSGQLGANVFLNLFCLDGADAVFCHFQYLLVVVQVL